MPLPRGAVSPRLYARRRGHPPCQLAPLAVLGGWKGKGAAGAGTCSVHALSLWLALLSSVPTIIAQRQLPPFFLDLPNRSYSNERPRGRFTASPGVKNCMPLVCNILQAVLLSGYYCSHFPYEETGLEVKTSQAQRGQSWFPGTLRLSDPKPMCMCVEKCCQSWNVLCLGGWPHQSASSLFVPSHLLGHGSRASSDPLPDCVGSCELRMVSTFLETGSSKRIIFCDSEMT